MPLRASTLLPHCFDAVLRAGEQGTAPHAAMGWELCPLNHNFHSQTGTDTHTSHSGWSGWDDQKKSLKLSNDSLLNYLIFSAGQSLQQEPQWLYFNSNCSHVQKMVLDLPALKPGGCPRCSYNTNLLLFICQKTWIENKTSSAKHLFWLQGSDKSKPCKEGQAMKITI